MTLLMTVPPLADLHPSHLQRTMPMLQRETVERLQKCARLAPRLAGLLDYRPGALRGSPEGLDVLAVRPRGEVEVAGHYMGALICGRVMARHVDAASIAVLDQAIGASARLFGIRQAPHVVAVDLPSPRFGESIETLAAAASDWGWRCLVRWRDQVTPDYRAAATLRLPAVGLPHAAPESCDPMIGLVIQTLYPVANPVPDPVTAIQGDELGEASS